MLVCIICVCFLLWLPGHNHGTCLAPVRLRLLLGDVEVAEWAAVAAMARFPADSAHSNDEILTFPVVRSGPASEDRRRPLKPSHWTNDQSLLQFVCFRLCSDTLASHACAFLGALGIRIRGISG